MMPWPATGPMLYFFLVGRGRHFEQLSCSCPLLTEVPHPSASDIRALVVGSDFGGYATSSEGSSTSLVLALQAGVR